MAEKKGVHIKTKEDASREEDIGGKKAATNARQQSPKDGRTASKPSTQGSPQSGTANESKERGESIQTQQSDASETGSDSSRKKKGNAKFSDENETREYYIDPKAKRSKYEKGAKGVKGAPGASAKAKDSEVMEGNSPNSEAEGNESPAQKLQEDSAKKPSGGRSDDEKSTQLQEDSAKKPSGGRSDDEKSTQLQEDSAKKPSVGRSDDEKSNQLREESAKKPSGGRSDDEKSTQLQEDSAKKASGGRSDDEKSSGVGSKGQGEEASLIRGSPEEKVEGLKASQSGVPSSVANMNRPEGKRNQSATDDEEPSPKRESPNDELEAQMAKQSGVRASLANITRPERKQKQSATDDEEPSLKRESPNDEVEAQMAKQSGVRASVANIIRSSGLEENTRKSFAKDKDEGDEPGGRKSIRQSIAEIPAFMRGASMRQVISSNTRLRAGSIKIKDPDTDSTNKKKVNMMKRPTEEDSEKKEAVPKVESNREITETVKSPSLKSISTAEVEETPRAESVTPEPVLEDPAPQEELKEKEEELVPPVPAPQEETVETTSRDSSPPKIQEEDEDIKDEPPVALERTIGSEDLKEGLIKSVRPGSVVLVSGRKDDEGFYRVRMAQPSKVFAYNVGAKASARFSTLIEEVVEEIAGSLKKSGDDQSVYTAYTQTGDSHNAKNSILSAVTKVSPKRSTKASISSHNASTNTDQQQTGFDVEDPIMAGWKMDRLHWNNNLYS